MKKNTKFLYGKKVNLKSFIKNGNPLWFRDLYSLAIIENQLICDDESLRKKTVDSKHLKKITINGRDFKLAQGSKFTMNQPTRRCHVLCLSRDGNKAALFRRFNADICIEINVELMIQAIKNANKSHNITVVGKNVNYFKKGGMPKTHDPFELVFEKEYERYNTEKEFRIAIFWPHDQESLVMTDGGERVNVFGEKPSSDDHISFEFTKAGLKDLIINVQDNKGKSIEDLSKL